MLTAIAQTKNKAVQKDIFLEQLMQIKPEQFSTILQNRKVYNVQIIYTQINRNKHNKPLFTDYTFNVSNQYFYPASTVKMPIAFLALEKLNELNKAGVNKYTAMLTDSAFDKQQIVYTQPNTIDSKPTIANYIKQIFLVSDNEAFNRLYEFLGQGYIQQKLKEKGYDSAIIRHRLQVSLTPQQNAATNPINFYDSTGKIIYQQSAQYNKNIYPALKVALGNGYYKGSVLVNEPFDFSLKNRLPLQDLKGILQAVLFPEAVAKSKRFNFTDEDAAFVKHWMSAYPRESGFPNYDTANYGDAYCKFLLFGAENKSIPDYIRVFNKVGDAYGFLIDAAYIIDTKNNIEFLLCATISCNTDGIYNDDKYDYETLGYPFLKNIGELMYNYELTRKRKYAPDLRDFMIDYNKR
jgi:hypothetical protein